MNFINFFGTKRMILNHLNSQIKRSIFKQHQSTGALNSKVHTPDWRSFNARQEYTDNRAKYTLYDHIVSGYNLYKHDSPFKFVYGGSIPEFQIAYETWGTLNSKRDNAILLHTGLSASSHAKSNEGNKQAGWWEKFIGPGLALDTNKYHIICTNVLGGCYGSTGPSSIDPTANDGMRYGTNFPLITIFDMIRAQFLMLDALGKFCFIIGIENLHASVGSSMGGMLSLASAALYPKRVGKLVSISSAARSHPFSIALRHAQRQVLLADPNWANGFYYDGKKPLSGMKLARTLSTITYITRNF
jgi:homoserine O-acetyltransferase